MQDHAIAAFSDPSRAALQAGAPLVGHLKPWAAYLHALLASVPGVQVCCCDCVLLGATFD